MWNHSLELMFLLISVILKEHTEKLYRINVYQAKITLNFQRKIKKCGGGFAFKASLGLDEPYAIRLVTRVEGAVVHTVCLTEKAFASQLWFTSLNGCNQTVLWDVPVGITNRHLTSFQDAM